MSLGEGWQAILAGVVWSGSPWIAFCGVHARVETKKQAKHPPVASHLLHTRSREREAPPGSARRFEGPWRWGRGGGQAAGCGRGQHPGARGEPAA